MAGVNGMSPMVQQQMAQALGMGNMAYGNQAAGGNMAGLQNNMQGMAGNSLSQQMLNNYGNNPYVDSMKGQIAEDANMLKQQNLGSLDSGPPPQACQGRLATVIR